MSVLAGTPVERRARRRLLGALTVIVTALALQLGQPQAAWAAETGPSAVDDSAVLALGSPEIVLPGAHDDIAGSSSLQLSLTAFPTDQLASLPPGSSVVSYRIVDAGFGTWSIGDADGRITFRPSGVTGTRTVRYLVVDGNERTDEGTATVTVSATAGARSDVVATVEGTSTTVDVLANDVPSRDADGSPGTIEKTSLRWLESELSPGIVSSDRLVVHDPGVGSFTIEARTGLVTFVPEAGYITPDEGALTYSAQDTTRTSDGGVVRHEISATVRWRVTTNRTSVSAAGQQLAYALVVRNNGNRSVRDLIVSSSTADVPGLVRAPVPLGGTLGDNRTTTCRATRTVRATDLRHAGLDAVVKVTAVPVSGSHRTAVNTGLVVRTPVDSRGVTVPTVPSAPAPTAAPDTASTTVGQPVVVDVLGNDRPGSPDVALDGSSVRLRTTTALPSGSVLYGDAKTLKVPGRGVFLVSGTGQVTFVPLGTSTGPAPTTGYQVADAGGRTARSTLDVVVR